MRKSLTREELSQKQLQSKHHWAEVGVQKPAKTPTSTEFLLGHQGCDIVSKTKKMDFRASFRVWGLSLCDEYAIKGARFGRGQTVFAIFLCTSLSNTSWRHPNGYLMRT